MAEKGADLPLPCVGADLPLPCVGAVVVVPNNRYSKPLPLPLPLPCAAPWCTSIVFCWASSDIMDSEQLVQHLFAFLKDSCPSTSNLLTHIIHKIKKYQAHNYLPLPLGALPLFFAGHLLILRDSESQLVQHLFAFLCDSCPSTSDLILLVLGLPTFDLNFGLLTSVSGSTHLSRLAHGSTLSA